MNPIAIYLGDEDRAQSHTTEAFALAAAGRKGEQLSDGTTIDIVGNVAYINSPMLAEYIILAPRDVGGGQYKLDLYGYTHRKDAMVPQGELRLSFDYTSYGFPINVGPELYYISDGVAFKTTAAIPTGIHSQRDPLGFLINFSLMSPIEDIQTEAQTWKTAMGFNATNAAVQGVVSFVAQGDNFYSVCPYGVDRSGSAPVYRASYALLYQPSATLITQTYNGGASNVKYTNVYPLFGYSEAGKDHAAAQSGFTLDSDIMEYNFPGNTVSAPFPILVPLGNNRVFMLYRKRTANSAYIYGGTFSLVARIISGTGYADVGASTAGITTSYYGGTSWNYGLTTAPAIVAPYDDQRNLYTFLSLAESQRDCVPLSADETILFGYRWGMAAKWGKTDVDHNTELVCYSVTASGIAQKGIVFKFWDDWMGNGTPHTIYNYATMPRYGMAYQGACCTGGNNVTVYYLQTRAAPGSDTFVPHGLVRFASSDGGATWDAGTLCTLNIDVPDAPYAYLVSPPQWIGKTSDDQPIILMGYLRGDDAGGGAVTLNKATLLESIDDGLTFDLSPCGTADLNYTVAAGQFLFQTQRGLGSIQALGNHEDGYAPSPYRHLPNYYGTASKICRDESADPGL